MKFRRFPCGEPQSLESDLLGETITGGACVRKFLLEKGTGALGLANREHGHPHIADDVAFACLIADLSRDRQRFFQRRDRARGVAFGQLDHAQVGERGRFFVARACLPRGGQERFGMRARALAVRR